jgi:hypothetical protein
MATANAREVVTPQDVLPVRSRVSFSAIFAGAVVALAFYLLLGLLGLALDLSVSAHVNDNWNEKLPIFALVWALVTLLVSLFIGGMVVSQCTAGETPGEAAVYGVIMWGVVFAMLLGLAAANVSFGFNAALAVANTPAGAKAVNDAADKSGQDDAARTAAEKAAQIIKDRSTQAAWWTFAGVLFSMLAAVAGAIAGSGPQVVIAGFPVRTRFVRRRVVTTPERVVRP